MNVFGTETLQEQLYIQLLQKVLAFVVANDIVLNHTIFYIASFGRGFPGCNRRTYRCGCQTNDGVDVHAGVGSVGGVQQRLYKPVDSYLLRLVNVLEAVEVLWVFNIEMESHILFIKFIFKEMKILFIGDPHFKYNNMDIVNVFVEETIKCITENKIDVCVIAGDVLDTHERLHQLPYNAAVSFIRRISAMCKKLFVLVGNHDYINNQQFLTDKHWLNPIKYWDNSNDVVSIVDKVVCYESEGHRPLVFVPYVPPGRFMEALLTSDCNWKESAIIFAHQEFRNSKLGVGNSKTGDTWSLKLPLVISGHIHKRHWCQDNIYYPGSIIQHTFGEEDNINTGLLLIDIAKDTNSMTFETVPIVIPKMETITIDCKDFEHVTKNRLDNLLPLDRKRLICNGTIDEFKSIRKTSAYASMDPKVKVVFRTKNAEGVTESSNKKYKSFDELVMQKTKENPTLAMILDNINKSFTELVDLNMID